jgi:DNA polymerase-1
MLNKINTDYQPDYIAVAFDRKAPTFRHLEYADI